MDLYDYFGRIAIIHLPERTDRLRALKRELTRIGIDVRGSKVTIPEAPMPADTGGFPSRGVHGNFLSHLGILRDALRDGLESVWVLEDDAIFSRRFAREAGAAGDRAARADLGPLLPRAIRSLTGAGRSAARARSLRPEALLVALLRGSTAGCSRGSSTTSSETMANQPGDPRGGRLYIDGAYTLFRRFNPDVTTLVGQSGAVGAAGLVEQPRRFALVRPGCGPAGADPSGARPARRAVALDRDNVWSGAPTDPDALGAMLAARKAQKEGSGG